MDALTVIIAVILAVVLAVLVWLVISVRGLKVADQTPQVTASLESLKADLISRQMEGMMSLRESLDTTGRTLNERLAEGTLSLDRRLEIFGEIENKLGQLERQTKSIEDIGRNIQTLSELLKPPKVRGGLGEVFLENLLGQILPPALFEMQYGFRDGQRVDAVIKLGDRLLPVDSKFPLEAFQRSREGDGAEAAGKEFCRSLRAQVDSISSKYIRPEHETTDFAVMYIPSEAVYYAMVTEHHDELFEYALARKVIPSSPGHLYAFLASVAAIYAEAGLAGNARQLTVVLNALKESVGRLDRFHHRMSGSARVLTLTLDRAQSETGAMRRRLEDWHDAGSDDISGQQQAEPPPSEGSE